MAKKSFKLSQKRQNTKSQRKKSQRKYLQRKKLNKSRKRQKGGMAKLGMGSNSKVTFAAKLGAFLLEGMKGSVDFDYSNQNKAFSGRQAEVSGALPFLHMNISEEEFRGILKGSNDKLKSGIASVCKSKGLNEKLEKVGFECDRQSENGNKSLEQGIIDSINNRWNIRGTGRKHLAKMARAMKAQASKNIIPAESIQWTNGFGEADCEDIERAKFSQGAPQTAVSVKPVQKPWYQFWG